MYANMNEVGMLNFFNILQVFNMVIKVIKGCYHSKERTQKFKGKDNQTCFNFC